MLDTLIIGAGPAGLTAATYLGRFHRRVLLIDGGGSRARWIPESHNIPGFPQGIGGADLLSHLRAHALRYGAEIRAGQVESLTLVNEGFAAKIGSEEILSRFVLLATGVRDHLPPLAGCEEAVLRALVRICPICDAFEATGRNIAVIGDGERGEREAEFLRTYSDRVTLINIAREANRDTGYLKRAEIRRIDAALSDLLIERDRLVLHPAGIEPLEFDVVYAALGCTPQIRLAAGLGAQLDESNALRVNAHQQTSVAGLYAAGDIVRGLNQVVVAAAEAAIAATDIHNQLRRRGAQWAAVTVVADSLRQPFCCQV